MKARVFVLLGILLAASRTVHAQAGHSNALVPKFPFDANLGMIASDSVRLRSGPSTSAGILATEGTGALGELLGTSHNSLDLGHGAYYWEHLKMFDGTEGWAFGQFVFTGLNRSQGSLPGVGPKGYDVGLFVSPAQAETLGIGLPTLVTLVDSELPRALPIKVKDSKDTPATDDGWLYLGTRDPESGGMEVESAVGIDNVTAQITVVYKEWSSASNGPVVSSRTRLTCTYNSGTRFPYFEAIRVESLAP
jgi:hypothetical protein